MINLDFIFGIFGHLTFNLNFFFIPISVSVIYYSATNDTSEKLASHLKLLKEEYTKLQRNYAELERKYSKLAAASGDKDLGEFSSFVSRLAMTVATLYGRKIYSDITIRLSDKTIPAHKFVLNARSEEWREEVLADIDELGMFVYSLPIILPQ